jgi:hypothetical protein
VGEEIMSLPSECKMPDLSGLDSLMGRLFIQAFIGEPGLSQKTRLYRSNFIRLADKALREYHESRELILAQIAEMNRSTESISRDGRNIYLFTFTDHIETCINAVRRLYKLLGRIKAEKQSPGLPRELRRLVETMEVIIVDIRDAIEHIDEMIQKDEVAPNRPIMAAGSENWDAVVVANEEIKFEDLAMVLRKMHEIALYLLTIKKNGQE